MRRLYYKVKFYWKGAEGKFEIRHLLARDHQDAMRQADRIMALDFTSYSLATPTKIFTPAR